MIGRAFACSTTLLLMIWAATARADEPINPSYSEVSWGGSADAVYESHAFAVVHEGIGMAVNEPGSSWRPVRGLVYRIAVERDLFFNALGRPDLAEQFLRRRGLGKTVKWTGYVTAVAGLFVTLWGLSEQRRVAMVAGLGALIGGAVTREIGEGLLKPVFPEDQALDMASRYNQGLRARLGLSFSGRF